MPTHERQLIRNAVVAQLLGRTTADQQVQASRREPWRQADLPAISVYTIEEESAHTSVDGGLTRALKLGIEIVVSMSERVDDALDGLALEVETALDEDPTLGGKTYDLVLASTKVMVVEEQRRAVGVAQLGFEITYQTPTRA